MQKLKERIVNEGRVIGTGILKVDSFLNHQIDPQFTMEMGRELASRFAGEGITKVLTVEASGIAVATAAGLALGVPVVFAKKGRASTQDAGVYSARVYSFTRREAVDISVSGRFLGPDDTVLIVDDFLAHGEALRGLVEIVRQAGSRLAGAGIVIEKVFQGGREKLKGQGVRIESLAAIREMSEDRIVFL
ncbi:MAG: xanthine phosphoribosyltransferase [Peptococcaceae bacterium]|nr:xanthine phosphoribosyltransferase [Peptococcaceae bacterium]